MVSDFWWLKSLKMLSMHENKTQFMQSLHQIFITKNRSYEALPVGEIHGGDKVWYGDRE